MGNAVSNKISQESALEAKNQASYYRMMAQEHQTRRHGLLQQANHSYVLGDGSQADTLEVQAKEEQRRFMEAKLRAAEAFVRANQPIIKRKPPRTLDLHGVPDDQARIVIEREVKEAMLNGECEMVFVLGTSEQEAIEGVASIVHPAVTKYAGKYGFSCRANSPARGCVEVDLTARPGQELSNRELYLLCVVIVVLLIGVNLFIATARQW